MSRSSSHVEAPSSRFRDDAIRCRHDSTEIDGTPHAVERHVCRLLTSQPGLSFSGLVVRRLGNDSVCLSGVVESNDESTDLDRLVKQIAGVDEVVNRLLVRSTASS